MKILNKRDLQEVALNYSPCGEFKYAVKVCKDYNKESLSFLVTNTHLPSYNLL